MIKGNKPAGYVITADAKGRKLELETRQCSHCQFSWIYQPGSGRKTGLCYYCMGLMCSRCAQMQWRKGRSKCVPYTEGVLAFDKNKYILDEKIGLYLRK